MAHNLDTRSMLERSLTHTPEIKAVLNHNHETEHLHESKKAAQKRGRAGRLRGKAKSKQNNKARGGKLAR